MAVTPFQRKICRLIADARKENGASYIAGGVSLNAFTKAPRISHDIDIFNDTLDALLAGWENDKKLLEQHHYDVKIIRERPTFIEAKRSGRYTQVEIDSLFFEKETPNAGELSKKWRQILKESEVIMDLLSAKDSGECVLDGNGELLNGSIGEICDNIKKGQNHFHEGSIHGAYPTISPRLRNATVR